MPGMRSTPAKPNLSLRKQLRSPQPVSKRRVQRAPAVSAHTSPPGGPEFNDGLPSSELTPLNRFEALFHLDPNGVQEMARRTYQEIVHKLRNKPEMEQIPQLELVLNEAAEYVANDDILISPEELESIKKAAIARLFANMLGVLEDSTSNYDDWQAQLNNLRLEVEELGYEFPFTDEEVAEKAALVKKRIILDLYNQVINENKSLSLFDHKLENLKKVCKELQEPSVLWHLEAADRRKTILEKTIQEMTEAIYQQKAAILLRDHYGKLCLLCRKEGIENPISEEDYEILLYSLKFSRLQQRLSTLVNSSLSFSKLMSVKNEVQSIAKDVKIDNPISEEIWQAACQRTHDYIKKEICKATTLSEFLDLTKYEMRKANISLLPDTNPMTKEELAARRLAITLIQIQNDAENIRNVSNDLRVFKMKVSYLRKSVKEAQVELPISEAELSMLELQTAQRRFDVLRERMLAPEGHQQMDMTMTEIETLKKQYALEY